MNSRVVTVRVDGRKEMIDMELQSNLPMYKLIYDVEECILAVAPMMIPRHQKATVICNRNRSIIQSHQTLEDANVWNGDYITLKYDE